MFWNKEDNKRLLGERVTKPQRREHTPIEEVNYRKGWIYDDEKGQRYANEIRRFMIMCTGKKLTFAKNPRRRLVNRE